MTVQGLDAAHAAELGARIKVMVEAEGLICNVHFAGSFDVLNIGIRAPFEREQVAPLTRPENLDKILEKHPSTVLTESKPKKGKNRCQTESCNTYIRPGSLAYALNPKRCATCSGRRSPRVKS